MSTVLSGSFVSPMDGSWSKVLKRFSHDFLEISFTIFLSSVGFSNFLRSFQNVLDCFLLQFIWLIRAFLCSFLFLLIVFFRFLFSSFSLVLSSELVGSFLFFFPRRVILDLISLHIPSNQGSVCVVLFLGRLIFVIFAESAVSVKNCVISLTVEFIFSKSEFRMN